MCAGEECGNCHQCTFAALWDRPDVMIGQLWTDCSCGVINVNGSGSITVVTEHCNHNKTILKTEMFPIYISVIKQNS